MAEDEFFKRIAETVEPDDVVSDRPAGTAERRARRRAETPNNELAGNDGQETSADDAPGEHPTLLPGGRRGRRGVRREVKGSDKRWFRAHLSMICAALIGVCGIGVGMVVAPRGDSGASRLRSAPGSPARPTLHRSGEAGRPPASGQDETRRSAAPGGGVEGVRALSDRASRRAKRASTAGVLQASTRRGFSVRHLHARASALSGGGSGQTNRLAAQMPSGTLN